MTDLETAPAETSETADSSVPATMIVFYRLYGAYARTEDNLARMYLLDLAEGSRHAIEAALNTIAGAPAFALRRKQPKPFTCPTNGHQNNNHGTRSTAVDTTLFTSL